MAQAKQWETEEIHQGISVFAQVPEGQFSVLSFFNYYFFTSLCNGFCYECCDVMSAMCVLCLWFMHSEDYETAQRHGEELVVCVLLECVLNLGNHDSVCIS